MCTVFICIADFRIFNVSVIITGDFAFINYGENHRNGKTSGIADAAEDGNNMDRRFQIIFQFSIDHQVALAMSKIVFIW